MSTSGTYLFQSPASDILIKDAYERAGVISAELDRQQIHAAQRSLNFILQDWINRGNNLWTVFTGFEAAMLGLIPNQYYYSMPPNAIDIKTAAIRTSVRNLGGTPFSSAGGNAENAFDGNPLTACTQTALGGYISYSWSSDYSISLVGIQANDNYTLTPNWILEFDYSQNGIDWLPVAFIPSQVYPVANVTQGIAGQGIIQWFNILSPVAAPYFRVLQVEGTNPLDVQELYFNNGINDTLITRLSEYEYSSLPNKSSSFGRPTSFYVNRGINPTLYLWPVPSVYYNNLYFSYWKSIEDIGALLNNAAIPPRFLEALTAELAFKLAVKLGDQNRISVLGPLAQQAYQSAGEEDRERVPLRIYGDYMQGWGQV
jgi:hypothetical protein